MALAHWSKLSCQGGILIQGLLEAMAASIRAKMRQAAGNQGILSLRGKRERTIAALQDAAVAVDGAIGIAKGAPSFQSCIKSRIQTPVSNPASAPLTFNSQMS